MSHTRAAKLIFALSASLGVLILHGFSFFTMAVCLYAAGAVLIKGSRAVTYLVVIFGGLSLLYVNGSGGTALLTIGAVLAVALSESSTSRYLFSISAAAILIEGVIAGVLPLAAAILVASPVKRDKLRAVILAGGVSAVLIIYGLPSVQEHRFFVLHENLYQGAVNWPEPAELNLGMPELILQAPGAATARMTIKVSGGGVRDNNPVGYITSDDRRYPVYPGENTVIIDEPEFPVSIRITRSWKPFSHPVIHFKFAEASI